VNLDARGEIKSKQKNHAAREEGGGRNWVGKMIFGGERKKSKVDEFILVWREKLRVSERKRKGLGKS